MTILGRNNLRYIYTTSRNKDETIIELWDKYFNEGTIQIVKRRDNQEITFTFIQVLIFYFDFKMYIILEVLGTQMTFWESINSLKVFKSS